MREKRNAYRLLVRKPEGRMDLVEVGWGDVVWLRIGTGGELL
jgi:hypothetical protein